VNDGATEESGTHNGIVIRQDAEGLVKVRIENGELTVSFDASKWGDLIAIYHDREPESTNHLAEGSLGEPKTVHGLSGKATDAYVARVDALDVNEYGFVLPSVVVLMEDGSLEWFQADPFIPEIKSFGALPWLKDITDLSFEPSREGNRTIFATDSDGQRWDVRSFCALMYVFDYEWVCEIGPAPDDDIEAIIVNFDTSEKLSVRKGLLNMGDAYAFYTGKYTLSADDGNPLFSIELWDELELDMSNPDFSSTPTLSSTYSLHADSIYMTLTLLKGDPLNKGMKEYSFWQPQAQEGLGGE